MQKDLGETKIEAMSAMAGAQMPPSFWQQDNPPPVYTQCYLQEEKVPCTKWPHFFFFFKGKIKFYNQIGNSAYLLFTIFKLWNMLENKDFN